VAALPVSPHAKRDAVHPENRNAEASRSGLAERFQRQESTAATEEIQRFVDLYKDSAPKIAVWAETNIPEGLSVFQLPEEH